MPPVKGIPGVKDVPIVDRKAKKDTRGFRHHATARLLCPGDMLKDFELDRVKFCHEVEHGTRAIIHDDLPAYLYPEGGYNSSAIDKGLLRGPFLVSVSIPAIYMFTANLFVVLPTHFHGGAHGPENDPGKGPGEEVSC